jgi:dTDP-4-dehydrorhamnose reductase
MQKIIVTGAGGQLGQELQALAETLSPDLAPGFSPDFVFADRTKLAIEDQAQVNAFFKDQRPAFCINCAAYTAVDKAESDKDNAFRINGDAPGYLAAACRDTGARLIHVSTDYVFDGSSATPLREDDPTAPINIYGASKLEGEKQAFRAHPDGVLVIRTSWVYSEFGNNFVKTMMRLMTERPAINVVDDQIGSPTYAADLAAAILRIVAASARGSDPIPSRGPDSISPPDSIPPPGSSSASGRPATPRFVPGIYNYSNEGEISWYEFALAIRELIGSSCAVSPIASANYPTPARRPHYSLLDKSLIKKTYGLTIPDWRSSLVTCIHRLRL